MAHDRRLVTASLLLILGITAGIYVSAGISHAYLAADDFQWLAGGYTFQLARLFNQIGGDHFYRPVIDVWFAAASTACGPSVACYHLGQLSLHLLNVALVFWLALTLFRDLRMAFFGALFFAVEPGYTQAVVWVSAATALLMTTFYVGSLVAQAVSWTVSGTRRTVCEWLAMLFFFCALFSHEAAVTLPLMSWIMWRDWAPERLTSRRALLGGLAAGVGTFLVLTLAANRRNTIFTESHYSVGVHAVQHALDYVVSLYVGPGGAFAYAASTGAILLLIAAGRSTRFGAAWLVVTMVPYLGFTWGNVSRYAYLPSIGFALAVAAALAMGSDWIAARVPSGRIGAQVGFFLVAMFVAARFARFDVPSIRSQVQWMEPWREYADHLARNSNPDVAGTVRVHPPASDVVDVMYVDPMIKWIEQNYGLDVIVER